jgi:hypothetical protein
MTQSSLSGRLFATVLLVCTLPALKASGQEGIPEIRTQGAFFRPPAGEQRQPPATTADLVRASSRLTAAERHSLGPLTAEERQRMRPEPARARLREKIGIARDLPQPVVLGALPSGLAAGTERTHAGGIAKREANGRLSWTTAFVSPGARAVRLHLSEAYLPPGSRAFVYTEQGEVHGPYSFEGGLGPEGFWTHSVAGEQVYLEVQFSGVGGDGALCRLVISQVAHLASTAAASLTPEAAAVPEDTSCFKDETCMTAADFGPIASVSRAVAALEFFDPAANGFFLCSGALIGAVGDPSTPYVLTANHCFSTQASATSLQATFNFVNTSCNQQPYPAESTFPSTLGSTLLATGTSSDFTFVRLAQNPPSGAYLLPWTTQDVSTFSGTKLYRLSHPAPSGIPLPQFFTRSAVVGSPLGTCAGAPVGNFIYSSQEVGGTTGGSSGSVITLADGSIVGQLFGKCGTDTSDDCAAANFYLLDGAFRPTYASVAQWLNPQGSGACTTGGTALCLNNGRFRITVSWQSSTSSGIGTPIQLTADTGYFWFFAATNVEVVVKVLNTCGSFGRFWVFAGGLTNVNVWMTVTDTQTGAVKTYINPINTPFQPIQDTSAFSTCP